MKSEMKMPRDRDREVKFLENSREILENQEIETFQNFGPNDFHLANFYFDQKCKFFMTKCEVACKISLFFLEKKVEI